MINDAYLAVGGVGDLDFRAAERRLGSEVTVTVTVDGSDHVAVAVDGSASTGNTTLVEERSAEIEMKIIRHGSINEIMNVRTSHR